MGRNSGNPSPLDESEFLLAVVNPLPFPRSEPVTATVRLPLADQIQGFDLLDPDGRKMAYETVGTVRQYRMNVSPLNSPGLIALEEVAVRFAAPDIPASGNTVYRVVPTSTPLLAASPRTDSVAVFENEFLSVTVAELGVVSLHDLKSGWKTENLFSFKDSADMGGLLLFYSGARGEALRSV